LAGLRFAGVRKDYGSIRALRGLDLEVAPEELLVLVGPSGSGKSSALRVAAGLEDATEGSIYIGGRDVTDVPPSERNISMVFQSYALFPHLTVAENIGFGLRARRVPRPETRARVESAATTVGWSAGRTSSRAGSASESRSPARSSASPTSSYSTSRSPTSTLSCAYTCARS
jgi:multiple sugar transport system ATP-binding protein